MVAMYVFNMQTKSDFLDNLFVYLMYFGIICSISTVFAGLQLTGRMSKKRIKAIAKITLPICLIATVVIMALIYFAVNS